MIPVSTGKDGFLTRNGTKVIMEKHVLKIMDATTIGISKSDPEYYRLEVPYAMRVTWSGEFVHAAPWSVGSQGRDNVSHGCVGMSMSNAIWLFNQTTVGDVVQVNGSPRTLEPRQRLHRLERRATWLTGSALSVQRLDASRLSRAGVACRPAVRSTWLASPRPAMLRAIPPKTIPWNGADRPPVEVVRAGRAGGTPRAARTSSGPSPSGRPRR